MDPREMRQLSLQYSFPFKFFEILQFGSPAELERSASFKLQFGIIKGLNLFSLSRLYSKSFSEGTIDDRFADYLVDMIEENDYEHISFKDLIENYKFHKEDYSEMAPYWKTALRYINPETMYHIIQTELRFHIAERSDIFRFSNPTNPVKFGRSRIWEHFQHYFCFDRERKIIQMISSGFD